MEMAGVLHTGGGALVYSIQTFILHYESMIYFKVQSFYLRQSLQIYELFFLLSACLCHLGIGGIC